MKGTCSLLADTASAVADTSALIWRISRSSVDGCMTFSLNLDPTTRFLISANRKPADHSNRERRLRQIARASLGFSEKPAHSPQLSQAMFSVEQAIFSVKCFDNVPHDRFHILQR
jgi:hypothetical protein